MGKLGKWTALAMTVLFGLLLAGCSLSHEPDPPPEDGVTLVIDLDTEDDVGFLQVDYKAGGNEGTGGISNADRKTPLGSKDRLYYELDGKCFAEPVDSDTFTVQFTVAEPGTEPNQGNVYAAENVTVVEPISLPLEFGVFRNIVISGSREAGYRAEVVS